ncbi:MAG: hypothetical protein ACI4V7_04435 [Succinivibrionaceae bacterium]
MNKTILANIEHFSAIINLIFCDIYNFIFGYGYGTFSANIAKYFSLETDAIPKSLNDGNLFIKILLEQGLIGIISVFLYMIFIIKSVFNNNYSVSMKLKNISTIIPIFISSIILQEFFNTFLMIFLIITVQFIFTSENLKSIINRKKSTFLEKSCITIIFSMTLIFSLNGLTSLKQIENDIDKNNNPNDIQSPLYKTWPRYNDFYEHLTINAGKKTLNLGIDLISLEALLNLHNVSTYSTNTQVYEYIEQISNKLKTNNNVKKVVDRDYEKDELNAHKIILFLKEYNKQQLDLRNILGNKCK